MVTDFTNFTLVRLAGGRSFAQQGFFETSMADIETEANTSRGVLYHHFANKDEMILEIIAENLGNAAAKMEEDLLNLQTTGKGDLYQLLISMLGVVEQITFGPGKAMSVHVWSLSLLRPEVNETVMAFFERMRQLLKQQLTKLQELGQVDKNADLDKLATTLFSIQIPAYIIQRLFTGKNALMPEDYAQSLLMLLPTSKPLT